VGSGILGIGLGVLGFRYSKAAAAIFLSALTITGIITFLYFRATGGFSGLDTDSGEGFVSSVINKAFLVFDLMGLLPQHIQVALLIFTGTFLAARIVAWYKNINAPEKEESPEERKKRKHGRSAQSLLAGVINCVITAQFPPRSLGLYQLIHNAAYLPQSASKSHLVPLRRA